MVLNIACLGRDDGLLGVNNAIFIVNCTSIEIQLALTHRNRTHQGIATGVFTVHIGAIGELLADVDGGIAICAAYRTRGIVQILGSKCDVFAGIELTGMVIDVTTNRHIQGIGRSHITLTVV